jgi:hypothetical protein
MANNTPDFDKMSPEEIMKWMETLAKRQGASEGMTTDANAEIADIDPDSVVIDEPGYVPSEGKMKGKKIETILPPRKTSEQAPAAATPSAPAQPPAAQAPVQQPAAQAPAPPPAAEPAGLSWLESLAADQGADFPALDLSSLGAELTPAASSAPAEPQTNPIDWLESLGKSEAPAEANPVDWLQDMGAPAEVTAPAEEPALANPIDWLQDMGAPDEVTSSVPSGVADPFASGADPVNWLESLAKGQGAKEEELTTSADLSVPTPPEDVAVDGPGYTPYSFDTPSFTPRQPELKMPLEATPEPAEVGDTALEDPSAWLDQLASSQGFDSRRSTSETKAAEPARMSDQEIQEALAKGQPVPHDQMEAWMSRQLEVGAQREEPPELFGGDEYDPDAPAVPAEIPDWLIEQVGSTPPEDAQPPVVEPLAVEPPALIEDILEPPASPDMPDWLKEEAPSSDLDSIFAAPAMELPPPELTPLEPAKAVSELDIDTSDPWVEAFDNEYQQGSVDITQVPAWYAKAVNDPTRAAAADRAASGEAVELADSRLQPETQLPEGEPENVPDWLSGLTTGAVEAEAIPAEDIPDWLKDDFQAAQPAAVDAPAAPAIQADVAAAEDVPDWLKGVDLNEVPAWLTETLGTNTSEQSVVQPVAEPPSVMIPAVPVAPAAPPAVPAAHSPAPVPVAVAQIDAASVLSAARSRVQSGDIDGGLSQYEQLVRANSSLQETVDDLTKVAEKAKNNPALYRVLGDAYMRTGKLQAALDTYRKALNQL